MRRFEYAVRFAPAEEGGYVVTCRDLPEVITQGEDVQDALAQAADAMEEAFAARMDDGLNFPAPSPPASAGVPGLTPARDVVKAALYLAMREAGISQADLAERLGVDEKEVRRMLDPLHGTKLPRLAQAVQVLGRELRIELVP
jgi:antitoxin HicB